jgi:RNA polymerase sigma-70 factor (ECF subfamily)
VAPIGTDDARRTSWLVERAQKGDQAAFGDLYRDCHRAVARIVGFYLPGPAGEDAVSETFLRAWVGLPRYRETGAPFSAWLAGIARNVVSEVRRSAARVQPRAELPDRPVDLEEGWSDSLALAEAVARLPHKQRVVIELKFLLGWTNEEVGRALGKKAGAVNTLQWRALERLKRMMET